MGHTRFLSPQPALDLAELHRPGFWGWELCSHTPLTVPQPGLGPRTAGLARQDGALSQGWPRPAPPHAQVHRAPSRAQPRRQAASTCRSRAAWMGRVWKSQGPEARSDPRGCALGAGAGWTAAEFVAESPVCPRTNPGNRQLPVLSPASR